MKLINLKEAAKIHGVSVWTFWHYVRLGLIKNYVESVKGNGGSRCHLWDYNDVMTGIDVVKAYKEKREKETLSKRGPKPIKFQIEFWKGELELHPFNLYLHQHVLATPSIQG